MVVDTVVVEHKSRRVRPLKANVDDVVKAAVHEVDGGRGLRVGHGRGSSLSLRGRSGPSSSN